MRAQHKLDKGSCRNPVFAIANYAFDTTVQDAFFVKDGVLHTPIADAFLNGITRQTVIALAQKRGYELRERAIIGTPDGWGLRDDDFLCVERRAAAALDDESPRVLLFEKPHDRWDQSDVSSQFLPTVERMTIERRRITDGLS